MADFSIKSRISITCPKGITPYLKQELIDLGYNILGERLAGIEIEGTLEDCMRLNLALRCAHRVHYQLKSFECTNADELYKQLKTVPWEDYVHKHGYVSVTSFINNRSINNTHFANLKIKDAIVDRIREKTGSRPNSGPDLSKNVVFLFWKGREATIYLDTSGESISRRGYKVDNHTASIQETLASAIILAGKWKKGQHFINPMCGSGTLAIEAALMATQKAPGLLRPNFAIKHIPGFDVNKWNQIRSFIKSNAQKSFEGKIIATDIDPKAIAAARKNARTAGVDHLIEFECVDYRDTEIPDGEGVVVFNPPYGERLGANKDLENLYTEMGDFLKQKCSGKWGYIFTGNFGLAKHIGLRSSQRIELYNSTIECRLLEFELY